MSPPLSAAVAAGTAQSTRTTTSPRLQRRSSSRTNLQRRAIDSPPRLFSPLKIMPMKERRQESVCNRVMRQTCWTLPPRSQRQSHSRRRRPPQERTIIAPKMAVVSNFSPPLRQLFLHEKKRRVPIYDRARINEDKYSTSHSLYFNLCHGFIPREHQRTV